MARCMRSPPGACCGHAQSRLHSITGSSVNKGPNAEEAGHLIFRSQQQSFVLRFSQRRVSCITYAFQYCAPCV